MSVSEATRLSWFDRGAAALAALLPNALVTPIGDADVEGRPLREFGPVYLCPLCLRLFNRDAITNRVLTAEHVPPRSFHGRELVLTCASCNHSSGYGPDAAARREQNPVDLLTRGLRTPHPIRLTLHTSQTRSGRIDPPEISVRLDKHEAGYRMFGADGVDPPAQRQAFWAEMERLVREADQDFEFTLNFHKDRYDEQLARVSWLRSAYLIAFAKFGYRCTLQPSWRQVRRQVQDPASPIIAGFRKLRPAGARDEKRLVFIERPEWARSIGVQFGHNFVFLPRPGDLDFYQRFEQVAETDLRTGMMEGGEAEWPQEPRHEWDFSEW